MFFSKKENTDKQELRNIYYSLIKDFKQMSMENFAEQGGGRRNPDGFRGRQRSYAKFYTTDVKGFYLRIVLSRKDVLELLREQNENPLKKSRAPFCKHMRINI